MTKTTALRLVVRYLDGAGELSDSLRQAKTVLEDMLSDRPGKKWDGASIRAAVESFIADHGRPPTTRELDALPGLPCHRSVELEFDRKAARWLRENYPGAKALFRAEDRTPAEYRSAFAAQYNRTRPRSGLEYNRTRDPYYPTWQYTAKVLGCRRWSELLHMCGEELDTRRARSFTVESSVQLLCDGPQGPRTYTLR